MPPLQKGGGELPAGVAVVGNPYSGRGANRKRVARLLARLEAARLEPRVVWDKAERAVMLADPGLDQWCRCVLVAGGDGTIGDVLNELARPERPCLGVALATLPIGNENLFAREFRFGVSPERIAAAIARGRSRRIDVGQCNGRLFSLMVSAGLDAEVVHRVDRWRVRPGDAGLRRVNRLSYGPHILGALHGYGYPLVRVEVEGEVVAEGAHAFVFNLPQYGGHLGICREAVGDDGKLDWVVFHRPGWRALAGYGLAVVRGRHLSRPDVSCGRAARVRLVPVDGDFPAPVQADGDPAGTVPAEVGLRPGGVQVVAMEAG